MTKKIPFHTGLVIGDETTREYHESPFKGRGWYIEYHNYKNTKLRWVTQVCLAACYYEPSSR
jgi:hypothetical protein